MGIKIVPQTTESRVAAARKNVGSALDTFIKSRTSILKANDTIKAAIEEDEDSIKLLRKSIEGAQTDVADNNKILAKLGEFLPSEKGVL